MPVKDNVQIAPAEGKLGVLIPGIGAVSTTFIAGVEAIKRGLGLPVGSLTQLSTVRLGKRTDGRANLQGLRGAAAGRSNRQPRRITHRAKSERAATGI